MAGYIIPEINLELTESQRATSLKLFKNQWFRSNIADLGDLHGAIDYLLVKPQFSALTDKLFDESGKLVSKGTWGAIKPLKIDLDPDAKLLYQTLSILWSAQFNPDPPSYATNKSHPSVNGTYSKGIGTVAKAALERKEEARRKKERDYSEAKARVEEQDTALIMPKVDAALEERLGKDWKDEAVEIACTSIRTRQLITAQKSANPDLTYTFFILTGFRKANMQGYSLTLGVIFSGEDKPEDLNLVPLSEINDGRYDTTCTITIGNNTDTYPGKGIVDKVVSEITKLAVWQFKGRQKERINLLSTKGEVDIPVIRRYEDCKISLLDANGNLCSVSKSMYGGQDKEAEGTPPYRLVGIVYRGSDHNYYTFKRSHSWYLYIFGDDTPPLAFASTVEGGEELLGYLREAANTNKTVRGFEQYRGEDNFKRESFPLPVVERYAKDAGLKYCVERDSWEEASD